MLRSVPQTEGLLLRRFATRAALASALALAILGGGVASASAALIVPLHGTIHLSIHQESGQRYLITASGQYTQAPSMVYVFVQSGVRECAPTRTAESFLVDSQMQSLGANAAAELISQGVDTPGATSGSYSVQGYWGVDAPRGAYRVCAYLMGPRANSQPCVPPHATVPPCAPPDATASARLTIGAPSTSTTHAAGVRIVAFYSTTQAAYNASARSGEAPPRVTTFPAGTLPVAFYFSYRHARPGVTRFTIIVHWPAPLGGVRQEGPYGLSSADGGNMLDDPVATPGLPGLYRVDLQIDGRLVARTSFRVAG